MRSSLHVFCTFLLSVCLCLAPFSAQAGPGMDIIPRLVPEGKGLVFKSGRAHREDRGISFVLRLFCQARNLRGVPNPLHWAATVVTSISTNYGWFQMVFPALIFFGYPYAGPPYTTNLPAGSSFGFNPTYQIAIARANWVVNAVSLEPDGTYNEYHGSNLAFYGVSAVQVGIPWWTVGAYTGNNGPLSVDIGAAVSPRELDLYLYVPGSLALCAPVTFVSPLMLFFDRERPKFDGVTKFPLYDEQNTPIRWPEANAPGYFLALDRNGNGKIDNGKELFGSGRNVNGFEVLKPYDQNEDGVIDEKDQVYSQLLLWNDKNGDAISQKSELTTLKAKHVESIDLNYMKGNVTPLATLVEFRESSTFVFRKTKKAVPHHGEIIDVWFGGAESNERIDYKMMRELTRRPYIDDGRTFTKYDPFSVIAPGFSMGKLFPGQ